MPNFQIAGRSDRWFDVLCIFSISPARMRTGAADLFLEALNEAGCGALLTAPLFLLDTGEISIAGRALGPDEAAELLGVWNAPDGEHHMRCHIPRHGIATVTDGRFDWLASVCFECCNAALGGGASTLRHRILPDRTVGEVAGRRLEELFEAMLAAG